VADGLDQCTVPLALQPSLAAAMARGKALTCLQWPPTAADDAFGDWEAAVRAHGAGCFMVCPKQLWLSELGALDCDPLEHAESCTELVVWHIQCQASMVPNHAATVLDWHSQVVPLALSGRRLGALCVSGGTPGALDECVVAEVAEYGAQLSQLLYALAVQEEQAAGAYVRGNGWLAGGGGQWAARAATIVARWSYHCDRQHIRSRRS
jgi:hypothetical protein